MTSTAQTDRIHQDNHKTFDINYSRQDGSSYSVKICQDCRSYYTARFIPSYYPVWPGSLFVGAKP